MISKKENKDGKIAGIIGSILVHLLLLLALLFWGLEAFIPDTGEEGLTVNYGTSDMGDGMFEPAPQEAIEDQLEPAPQPEPVPATPPITEAPTAPSQSDLQTQDIEESLEMKEAREKAEKEKELERKRQEELRKQQEAEAKRIAEEKRKAEEAKKKAQEEAAKKAQSAGKVFGSGGTGTDTSSKGEGVTGNQGNQGNPLGDANSTNRNGGGTGDGHSYNLTGRSIIGKIPEPSYNKNIEGVIVVSIEVNAAGTVINAKAGAAGTTISDATLRNQAVAAAYKAKFNNISSNTTQSGTITYRYKLN